MPKSSAMYLLMFYPQLDIYIIFRTLRIICLAGILYFNDFLYKVCRVISYVQKTKGKCLCVRTQNISKVYFQMQFNEI